MALETRNFVKNDSGFVCAHCGAEVPPLQYTSRNHCPHCLWSLHVDNLPGDRENPCKGEMMPVQVLPDPKKEFIILHRCTKCGEEKRNRSAKDDNRALLIKLTAGIL